MQIALERHGDVVVVLPTGRLDTNTSSELEGELLPLVEEPGQRVVMDMESLSYVSSAGLRVLLMAAKRSRIAGGGLVLCNLSDSIREVFDVSGFSAIITLESDREAALAAV